MLLSLTSLLCFGVCPPGNSTPESLQSSDNTQIRLGNDYFTIYTHKNLFTNDENTKYHVTPEMVTYYLCTRPQANCTEIKRPRDITPTNQKLVFLIHGWAEHRQKPWYGHLTNAILTNYPDHDVIQIDWSDPAGQFYLTSVSNTKKIGRLIGRFLTDLNDVIPLDNCMLIGHSLGGHVASYAAKSVTNLTGQKIPKIIALDPAGPLFEHFRHENERLNPNDARAVQVVHTDGGTFGFKAACGTIDFFVNGGQSQPGCGIIRGDLLKFWRLPSWINAIMCNHQRSQWIFIESVKNPATIFGKRCTGWTKYKLGRCDDGQVADMGDLWMTGKRGLFYLETAGEEPFAKGNRRGIKWSSILRW